MKRQFDKALFTDPTQRDPMFFKPLKQHEEYFKVYGNKMKCVDEKIKLQGNFDTVKARTLAVVFEKCDPLLRSTCKTEEEI